MINKNKMSDYAHSMIFPEPDSWYGLDKYSHFYWTRSIRSVFRVHKKLKENSFHYFGLKEKCEYIDFCTLTFVSSESDTLDELSNIINL